MSIFMFACEGVQICSWLEMVISPHDFIHASQVESKHHKMEDTEASNLFSSTHEGLNASIKRGGNHDTEVSAPRCSQVFQSVELKKAS